MGPIGRVTARLVPGIAQIVASLQPTAEYWTERNRVALSGHGPVWLALGDSTAQGIGADRPIDGWVGCLERQLVESGRNLRLINLSESGARCNDVATTQLDAFDAIVALHGPPALVTIAIGANDVFRSPTLRGVAGHLEQIGERVPPGTVIASVPQAPISIVARVANHLIRSTAARHQLTVADITQTFCAPYRGRLASDRFHPNGRGHSEWAEAFARAIGLPSVKHRTAPATSTAP